MPQTRTQTGLCHGHLWGLTLTSGFLGVSRLLAAQLLHPGWDMLLLHHILLLVGLGRAEPDTLQSLTATPCPIPARNTQAVVSSHAIQLPACMLPGMDKPVPAQESQQEVHRATSVSTPHCILWAGRETMSSKGGPQTCPRPLVQALQGSTKQGTSSFTLSPFMAPAALLGK